MRDGILTSTTRYIADAITNNLISFAHCPLNRNGTQTYGLGSTQYTGWNQLDYFHSQSTEHP